MNLTYKSLFTKLATFAKKHALLCLITSVLYALFIVGFGYVISALISSHHGLLALMSGDPSSSYDLTNIFATVIAINTASFLVLDIFSLGMCQYMLAIIRDPKKCPITTTTTFFSHGTWRYCLSFTALKAGYSCLVCYVVFMLFTNSIFNIAHIKDMNRLTLLLCLLFGTVLSHIVVEQYLQAIYYYSNYLIIDGNQSFTKIFSKAHTLTKRVGIVKTLFVNNLTGITYLLLQSLFGIITALLFYESSIITPALIHILDDTSLILAFIGLLIIVVSTKIKYIVGICTPLHLLCNAVLYENLQETEAKTQ